MILSFYDKDFIGLQNNASLLVDDKSFKLVKRPIEMNDFNCTCEPFTENIQPTFIVVKNDRGSNKELVYSCLAGIPELTAENKTEINGTDLKALFSSEVVLQYGTYANVSQVISYIFKEWDNQVNRGYINCSLEFKGGAELVGLDTLVPNTEKGIFNALDEIKNYLNAYNLYIDSEIDLIGKQVKFYIGKTISAETPLKIRLKDYGVRNYGKWVADVNEVEAYYLNGENWEKGLTWILTSDNQVTVTEELRDIYPVKKKIVSSTESLNQANIEALQELLNYRYNENLTIPSIGLNVSFETKFNIILEDGREYKSLPCGELIYDTSGLIKVQIGYRYTGVDFI